MLLLVGPGFGAAYSQGNQDTLMIAPDTIVNQDIIPYNEILIAVGESRKRTSLI